MLNEARERAEAFAERFRGRVAELDVPELGEAMHELAAIHDLGGRAGSYAVLSYSLDTADPARGALLQKARELGAAIETQLLFFDLEWNLVPAERADELVEAPELAFARPPPAHAAPLPALPALGARGARAHGDERHGRVCVPAALHRADIRPAGASPRPGRARLARGGPLAPAGPRPRAPRARRPRRSPSRSGRTWARARSSSTPCSRTRRPRTGCAATRTGSRRATSPTRRATSRSRR